MADFTQKDLDRLKEINVQLEGRTRRTQKYIALEKEAVGLKKQQIAHEKTMESIRVSEEGIQKRINSTIKDKEGSISSILKAAMKLDISTASELMNRRLIATQSKKLAEGQQDISKSLSQDVKDGKITVTDRKKILNIQEGISSGKIKEKDITGKLGGLSKKYQASGLDYGKGLAGQAKTQSKIGGLINKSSGGLAKWGARLGIAGIAIGFIAKAVSGFSKKIDSVGKTFGYLTNAAPDFRDSLIDSGNEAIMIGKGLEDVLSVTSQLSSEFGITLKESKDIAGSVLETAVATGISNDEATKLFGTFIQIGNLTAKQAENLIENTAQLAAQKGVAPVAVLQDMAGSAEEIAGFTKDGGKNIAEAAVQARQMGLSLSTTAKIADGLLDFESSIANEMEASIMIGKQLNFQKARQLALEGDIAGATKNIVDQVGSEADFNALNVLQRRSLAKSIGVSVNEMAKLVRGSEKLTLSGALAGKSFDDLVGQDALSGLTSIINSLKMVGAAIMDEVGKPIAKMMKDFQESLMDEKGMKAFKDRMMGFVSSIANFFTATLPDIINGIMKGIELLSFGAAFEGNVEDYYIPSKTGLIGDIPQAQDGGMVKVHDGEVILNPIQQQQYGGGMTDEQAQMMGKTIASNISLSSTLDHGRHKVQLNSTLSPLGGNPMNPGK